jgi:peptidoglycan/LPS O-acetylase OafA/YrhL
MSQPIPGWSRTPAGALTGRRNPLPRNASITARIPGALLTALALLAFAPLGWGGAGQPGGPGAALLVAGLAAMLLATACRGEARPLPPDLDPRLRPGSGSAAALDGAAARQHDPDAPGHVRPRAPGHRLG